LGVELEIAGQRGARRTAALAERDAQSKSVEATNRATAAEAWRAYFQVLAAEEVLRLVMRLEANAKRLSDAASVASRRGAVPGVEADLAEAAYVRVVQRRIDARRDEQRARSELAGFLGLDSVQELQVEGTLTPLLEAERVTAASTGDRPEAAAREAESRAFSARANAQRRSRVPSPMVSAFVARDGFDERVLGVGLVLPLPLPEPIGRMHSGEIAESEALARRAKFLAADSRRRAKADLLAALASYDAAREATHTYTKERVERAETTLASLAMEVEAGRIGTRDAVILQEPLFELLLGGVEASRQLCLSSAEVARAAGMRLEEGGAP
jgi:cobalt-zinc-cadmium efflux system outer membrane protein